MKFFNRCVTKAVDYQCPNNYWENERGCPTFGLCFIYNVSLKSAIFEAWSCLMMSLRCNTLDYFVHIQKGETHSYTMVLIRPIWWFSFQVYMAWGSNYQFNTNMIASLLSTEDSIKTNLIFFLRGGSLYVILIIGGTVLEVLAPVSPCHSLVLFYL